MSDPYMGEIRMFAGTFAPDGWALCRGQLLAISEYDALFTLIGTTYGGDGMNTFALPDLSCRVPVHRGGSYQVGEVGGVETVTLTGAQMPAHTHPAMASRDTAGSTQPGNNVLANLPDATNVAYGTDAPKTWLSSSSVSTEGGSQPHDNMSPYLVVNYIISLYGIFPTQA